MGEELEKWWREKGWNALVGVGLVTLAAFLIALMFSHGGEIAQSLGNVVGGALGAIAAIVAVRIAFKDQAKAEADRRAAELASIRLALRTEVGMIATVCLAELSDWIAARAVGTRKDPRTAVMPPLEIYTAMAGQMGRLTRDEVVSLIGFASTLADLRTLAARLMQQANQAVEDRAAIVTLLSNAACEAAKCLRAIPDLEFSKDSGFLAALDKGCEVSRLAREGSRAAVRDTWQGTDLLLELLDGKAIEAGEVDVGGRTLPNALSFTVRVTNRGKQLLWRCQVMLAGPGGYTVAVSPTFDLRPGEKNEPIPFVRVMDWDQAEPKASAWSYARLPTGEWRVQQGWWMLNPGRYDVMVFSGNTGPASITIDLLQREKSRAWDVQLVQEPREGKEDESG